MIELIAKVVAHKIKGTEPTTIGEIRAIEQQILEKSLIAFHAYEMWCRSIKNRPLIRKNEYDDGGIYDHRRYPVLIKVIKEHNL